MIELNAIRKQARRDLMLKCPGGRARSRLWDHSSRVCDCALLIPRIPELANHNLDHDVLAIAALYHDAGWAVQHAEGEIGVDDVLESITSAIQRTLAASFMLEQLQGLASKNTLEIAAECIRVLSDHDISDLRAQIVAEADHLDEFSVLSSCAKVSKQLVDGKPIEAVIETWENQICYGFWTAKIKDSFRFESIREIARARLQVLEQHIEYIKCHNRSLDLKQMLDSLPE